MITTAPLKIGKNPAPGTPSEVEVAKPSENPGTIKIVPNATNSKPGIVSPLYILAPL
jgi:hypothetical protein